MAGEPDVAVPKGEFAAIIKVSPGRVSQMIAEGKIGRDALDGEGRNARIWVNAAKRQIAARTDIGQRFGNGIDTQLDLRPTEASASPKAPPAPADQVAEQIKLARLRSLTLANEREAETRLAEQGRYIPTADVNAALNKVAADMMSIIMGALPDVAAELAAELKVPQRDVLHRLRLSFRGVRENAAKAVRAGADRLPRLVQDEVPGDDNALLVAGEPN